MVGVNGGKFPDIRKHLDDNIGGAYKDMDLAYVIQIIYLVRAYLLLLRRFDEFPEGGKIDPEACEYSHSTRPRTQ